MGASKPPPSPRRGAFRGVAPLLSCWALMGWVSCFPAPICGQERRPISAADGGTYPCVLAETCPRPENAALCLSGGAPEKPCVTCDALACTLVSPESCD